MHPCILYALCKPLCHADTKCWRDTVIYHCYTIRALLSTSVKSPNFSEKALAASPPLHFREPIIY